MYAEQNGRDTGNDAGTGVTQGEEDTGGVEEAVAVLMRFPIFYTITKTDKFYRLFYLHFDGDVRYCKFVVCEHL